jgi:hypothetical protein
MAQTRRQSRQQNREMRVRELGYSAEIRLQGLPNQILRLAIQTNYHNIKELKDPLRDASSWILLDIYFNLL